MRRQLYFCPMQVTPPFILRTLMPGLTWKVNTTEKVIYVTFDDGPHPEITPRVLDILDQFQAKATFFCVGENVKKYPDTYQEILRRGHQTGNHSHNHLKGWMTGNKDYFNNIKQAAELIDSKLFRPPYGKITPGQSRHLKKQFQIVMWSVISYDFYAGISPEQCLKNVVNNSHPGTIAVFHDSEKSAKNMLYALPRYLETMKTIGYVFRSLENNTK